MWAVAIGIFVLVAAVAVAVATTIYLRSPKSGLPAELQERRRELKARLRRAALRIPESPQLAGGDAVAHREAGAVEAKLLAKNPRGALAEAERILSGDPTDPRAHLLLTRALIACGELDAALGEVARARELGARGPMLDYLDARARHFSRLRAQSDESGAPAAPIPPLIAPYELLILQLERQRQRSDRAAAVWLAGETDRTLDHVEIARLVTEHFTAYYRDLDLLLGAVEEEPAFAEALYHAARLAVKSGFIDEGREIFERIEPLMADTPERFYYERDLARLRDEDEPVSWLPDVQSSSGRKIAKLKIIE